ncbi:MAG TPA: glycoside hydrolase family 28 protein [Tepidisphaeraceae bacterium]|nr:glycoside hydrolase family 28 protein [Tepidisphaeraceae bacterium]
MRFAFVLTGVAAVVLNGWLSWACAQATLPANFSVAKPTIPDKTFDIADFGAVGGGKTLNTTAFRNAVAACAKAGGGTVAVPSRTFLTGPFSLSSNVDLRLAAGSTILFTDNPADLTVTASGFENDISAENCHDIAITGSGTIDGNGSYFWRNFVGPKNDPYDDPWMPHRPRLIALNNCTRVLVQGVTLTNSPMFHLVPSRCRDVTIDGIRILSPANSPNTDGIDPSGANFLITGCTIDTGDDCIAVKGGNRYDRDRPAVENFLITNCTFLHGHGMSIGSETNGGVRNMIVQNCTFNGTEAGIRLKSPRGRGGITQNLTYENLTMKNVMIPILITSWYPKIPSRPELYPAHAITDLTPIWRHILIRNVTAVESTIAGQIAGLPEMPVEDVVLENVRISADKPIEIIHARGIRFINCKISSKSGKPVLYDAQVQGLE